MSGLLRLYPAAWRDRYETEVGDLLLAHPSTVGDRIDLLRGALDAWIHPQVRRRPDCVSDDRRRVPAGAGPAAAILGGLLFVAGGLAFASTNAIGPSGDADHTLALLILVSGMLATSLGSVAMAPAGAPRRAAVAMVGGAVLDLFPWPILALGFLTWVGAAIVLGAALIARGRVVGFVPVAIGVTLATFNTETDRALVAVPVGLLWIAFAFAHLRRGAPATPPVPAAGEG
ncbi:MAG: hypothetical protein ABIZ72_05175 [Candidatus Limnocylindrales bacterium]